MPTSSSRFGRRSAVVAGAVAAVLVTGALSAQPALADNSSTLTVVGTSDVYDSNLIQSVIKPDFEAANPGITLNYVSKGSGAAIAYAEQGAASALLVHAPSLENQFVQAGYSYNNQPGNAFFWGDYVLLGPQSDPAAVNAKDRHDIVGAYERVAALGKTGKANFVSRGGTPGTTVQEHAIWALTTGITTCDVSDLNGGGESPSTTTGPCPTNISYPSWYHATGLTQGPNITNADACNYPGGNCYVFTDRGTYNYLQSTGAAQNLKIVTRNNSVSARGGVSLLVNSFHGYAVNPNSFSGTTAAGINLPAAQQFLSFVTSPAEQAKIGNYLNGTNDAPFRPDAAPILTASTPPAAVRGGTSVSIGGTLTNVVPGTPALAGKTVALTGTGSSGTTSLLTTTDSRGNYKFTFVPTSQMSYTVSTDQITQVEYPALDPPFSDLLVPTSTTVGSIALIGNPVLTSAKGGAGRLRLAGTLNPPPGDNNASLTLYIQQSDGSFAASGDIPVSAGDTTFSASIPEQAGTYTFYLRYSDGSYFAAGNSSTFTKTVK